MDFREFYKKFAEQELVEAKKKKPDADGDGVPDWADKKPGKDDHADKKDKKKSLKDWFEQISNDVLTEAEQITIAPAKQNTQVIKQGNKTLGTVTNPQLANQIKQSIGKGEMSLAGSEIKEQEKEKKESGKDSHKRLKRQYRDNENDNAHTENALLLATHFGSDEDVKHARAALAHREKHGGYSSDNREASQHLKRMHNIHKKYAHKLSENVIEEAEKWIQKAISKPGALKKQLGVPADEKIPAGKLSAAAKKGGKLGQRARLAQTLKSFNKEDVSETEVEESGLQAYLGKKKYGKEGMAALQKAGREGASKEKMAKIRAQHDKLDEADKPNYWVHDEKENHYYGPYSSESSAKEGGRVGPGATIKKFPSSVRNPRTMNPSAARLANVGKGAATGTKMNEKAVSKKQQKFMGMVHAAQKGEEPASKAVADVAKTMKKKDVKDFAKTKHKGLPEKKKKTNEADRPLDGDQLGPGSHSGRSKFVLETTQVNESMDHTIKAAYHEGKSHGLGKHAYSCKYESGSDHAKQYHEGYKHGLDECYGNIPMQPNVGLVGEGGMPAATVPGMAQQTMPAMEADMEEGNAFTGKLASTPKGGSFELDGKTFKDTSSIEEMDSFAFESLDNQLNALLKEDIAPVAEGLSVSMSTGNEGAADSVSVTGTDDEAGKLLAFIKQVGLGGMGGDSPEAAHGEPAAVVAVSDYGAPKFAGHDNPDMKALLDKVGVGSEDYKDEEGHEHSHEDACNECGGMMEAGHSCGKKEVEEVQTPDQLEADAVSEDDGEGYEQSQAAAAEIDSALAGAQGNKDVEVAEGGDGMEDEEPVTEAKKHKKESTAEKDDKAEKAAKKVAKDIEYDEGHKGKDDKKAEKAGKEVKKDIEYDDKKDKKKKVDEWANNAGKDGTDASFEQDMEFMLNVISGGLNKKKSTGQQTIPVLAGDEKRTNISEDIVDVLKLAGLK